MEKKALIQLKTDNPSKEQYKYYQFDGNTIEVPVGKLIEVPLWVAVRAKEIGDIDDYREI